MRGIAWIVTIVFAACAAAPPVVEQHETVVLGCETLAIAPGEHACARTDGVLSWRRMRSRFGGEVAQLPVDYVDLDVEHVALVPLPAGRRIARITVISEEDVDVVTLHAERSQAAADAGPRALALRLDRRSPPLSVVLRTDDPHDERTLATFGLR